MLLPLFPSLHFWWFQEHTVCWVPFSAGWSHQHNLVPLGEGSRCFLLSTASWKDSLAIFHTLGNMHRASWHLEGVVYISTFIIDFPWAPFILLFVGTRVEPFLEDTVMLDGSCLCKVRHKDPSLQKRGSRGSSRGKVPTVGML